MLSFSSQHLHFLHFLQASLPKRNTFCMIRFVTDKTLNRETGREQGRCRQFYQLRLSTLDQTQLRLYRLLTISLREVRSSTAAPFVQNNSKLQRAIEVWGFTPKFETFIVAVTDINSYPQYSATTIKCSKSHMTSVISFCHYKYKSQLQVPGSTEIQTVRENNIPSWK